MLQFVQSVNINSLKETMPLPYFYPYLKSELITWLLACKIYLFKPKKEVEMNGVQK